MKNRKMFRKLHIGAAILIVITVCTFLLLWVGNRDKEPKLQIEANNCYEETLHVISDNDYLPYSFTDSEGINTGHDVEVIALIANELNMNLDLKFVSWNEGVKSIVQGDADVLLTCDYYDDFEGADTVLKTEPIALDEFVVFSKGKIKSADELYKKKIGIMVNANVLPYIRMLDLEDRCVQYPTNKDAVTALEKGEIDCTIIRYTVGEAILKSLKYRDISSSLSIGNSYLCFDVKSGDEELLYRMNNVIEKLKVSGELDKLHDKWLTSFVHKYTFFEIITTNIWIVPLFILIIVGFFVMAIWFERKTIMAETDNNDRMMALADQFESLYDVELESGKYEFYVKGKNFDDVRTRMVRGNDFVEDTIKNLSVIYPEDRNLVKNSISIENIKRNLEKEKFYEIFYRVNANNGPAWARMRILYKDSGKKNVIIGVFDAEDEVSAKMKSEQLRKEQIARMTGGVSSYIVYPKTERFVIITQDSYLSGNYPESEDYTTSITRYIENDVFEPDRAMAKERLSLSSMVRHLKNEDEYTVLYRDISTGNPRWYEMRAVKLSENEILYGFDDKDDEILNQLILEKMEEDFFAMFCLNMDSKTVETIKDVPGLISKKGTLLPYSQFIEKLTSDSNVETNEFWMKNKDINYFKQRFEKEDKSVFLYKSILEDGTKWGSITEFVISRHEDKTPALIAIGFSLLDTEAGEKQELQIELKTARDVAETANKSKTNFLFNMSHDIRTPMNAITGFTAMAKKYINEKDKVFEYLDKIDTSGQQLLSLINQVLEMARIESGRAELDEKPISIKREYKSLITVFTEQAKVYGLEFCPSLLDIEHNNIIADKARMSSIILNIIGNAMKYTPKGGKIDFIFREIPSEKEGYSSYVLTVSDTGIGMSSEYLKVLFEPFTREKNSTVSRIQGTGLGMSIVKELVDLMGGEIKVESEVGNGTRFDITLDFKIDKDAESDKESDFDMDSLSLEGLRVLIVEDNDLNREIATDILEEEGVFVETAIDGSIAVKILEEKGKDYYDFILMDIQMPIMGGFEATGIIRKMYPDLKAPIIALSANAFAEDREASIKAGMDDHVAKPININNLFKVLARFI